MSASNSLSFSFPPRGFAGANYTQTTEYVAFAPDITVKKFRTLPVKLPHDQNVVLFIHLIFLQSNKHGGLYKFVTQYLFYISYNSCDASTSSMRFRLYCILTIFIQLDSNIGHAGRSLVVTAYYHFLIYYIACSYRAYVSIAQKSRRLLRECILCTA